MLSELYSWHVTTAIDALHLVKLLNPMSCIRWQYLEWKFYVEGVKLWLTIVQGQKISQI